MSNTVIVTYSGSTPGANSNVYPLFSTVTAFQGARFPQCCGLKRFMVDLKHSHDGTFRLSKSVNRGTSWTIVNEQAATGGGTDSNTYDANIEPYDDFKVDWVNGGSAQSTWFPSLSFSDERGPSA